MTNKKKSDEPGNGKGRLSRPALSRSRRNHPNKQLRPRRPSNKKPYSDSFARPTDALRGSGPIPRDPEIEPWLRLPSIKAEIKSMVEDIGPQATSQVSQLRGGNG